MSSSLRQRILSVYRGQTPDVVPFMLDLSHWFYHKNRLAWDLSQSYAEPERELIDYHKRVGAGFYVANLGSFYCVEHGDDVTATTSKSDDGREITWQYDTPLGSIHRSRRWEDETYAWGISRWGIESEADLRAFGHAMGSRTYAPLWDRYEA